MTKDDVIDLIKDAGYGVLATLDGKQPKARPMMPYLDEDGNLLIAALATSRTIDQIKKNPLVEMCFIDRKMAFARISGKSLISTAKEKKELIWNNNPMLRQYFSGPEDPNFVLLVIETGNVEAMTPFQKSPEKISLK